MRTAQSTSLKHAVTSILVPKRSKWVFRESLYSLGTPGHLLSPDLFLNYRHIVEYILHIQYTSNSYRQFLFSLWHSSVDVKWGPFCRLRHAAKSDAFQPFYFSGHLSTLPFWGRYSKPETLTYDVLYAKQDDAFQPFYFLGHLSTLPFWGRYRKPETLTYDVLYAKQDDAFQPFYFLGHLSTLPFWGRYSKPETLTYDVLYAKQDDAFQPFYFSGHLSTLPFWGCYSKPETLTYDVLYAKQDDAFQPFYFSGHLSTLPFGGATASLKHCHMMFKM